MPDSIRDVMTPSPLAVNAEASLQMVAETMRANNVGDVLVTDNGRLRGILTDRDIVVRGVAAGLDPTTALAAECCSSALHTVNAEDPAERAVELMRQHSLRRLPVIDDSHLVGIISIGDLAISRDPNSALADISTAPPNQ